jgi:hypothetical protein
VRTEILLLSERRPLVFNVPVIAIQQSRSEIGRGRISGEIGVIEKLKVWKPRLLRIAENAKFDIIYVGVRLHMSRDSA